MKKPTLRRTVKLDHFRPREVPGPLQPYTNPDIPPWQFGNIADATLGPMPVYLDTPYQPLGKAPIAS
jgi:hypothetical protein